MKKKLSILIPTYNYVVLPLVQELSRQGGGVEHDVEIIVADDASTDASCKEANRAMAGLPYCSYIELEENLGRARIRNLLADKAEGEWLLFMDGDAAVISDSFLQMYIDEAGRSEVVCGGLIHPDKLPSSEVTLRYRYERAADKHRSAAERMKHPYNCFSTFCFMIRKEVFQTIRFDESCREYGHEDTLFGEELKKRNFTIHHTDNPLMHMGLEDNAVFLKKTEMALSSLLRLQQDGRHLYSPLTVKYEQLQRWHLHKILPPLFKLTAPLLRHNLLGDSPNLLLFALYKLGYYATLRGEASGEIKN